MSKEKQNLVCSICSNDLEKETEASINGCNHKFCFSCIHKWATDYIKDCPNCRTKFFLIKRDEKETQVDWCHTEGRGGDFPNCLHCDLPCGPPPNGHGPWGGCEYFDSGIHSHCTKSPDVDFKKIDENMCPQCRENTYGIADLCPGCKKSVGADVDYENFICERGCGYEPVPKFSDSDDDDDD